ncbi:hypothetical protein IWZ00DRAFT_365294 [Phyllosticta capitalensis]
MKSDETTTGSIRAPRLGVEILFVNCALLPLLSGALLGSFLLRRTHLKPPRLRALCRLELLSRGHRRRLRNSLRATLLLNVAMVHTIIFVLGWWRIIFIVRVGDVRTISGALLSICRFGSSFRDRLGLRSALLDVGIVPVRIVRPVLAVKFAFFDILDRAGFDGSRKDVSDGA